LLLYLHVHHAE